MGMGKWKGECGQHHSRKWEVETSYPGQMGKLIKIYVIFRNWKGNQYRGWNDLTKSSPIMAGSQQIINQETEDKHVVQRNRCNHWKN